MDFPFFAELQSFQDLGGWNERQRAGAPPEWVPTGVDREAEGGNGLAAGPNGTDYNPHSAPRQGRDPIWFPAWRQERGPIDEEHELTPCQSEVKGQ